MRVVCQKVIDAVGVECSDSPWLRLGAEYAVLAISVRPGKETEVLIWHGADEIGWWDSRAFVSASEKTPKSWSARLHPSGTLEIAPTAWLEPGFWEAFTEGDPSALAVFRENLEGILEEDG